MEEERQPDRDGLLLPIMAQLAELQRQLSGLAQLPTKVSTPEEIIKAAEVLDLQESALTRKGNKEQFKFCRVLLALLDAAADCWSQDDSLVAERAIQAKGFITALQETTKTQIKKIRLADRSESGWQLVEHYEADRIADDSDDEKKIRAAEKQAAAAKKASAARTKSPRTGRINICN